MKSAKVYEDVSNKGEDEDRHDEDQHDETHTESVTSSSGTDDYLAKHSMDIEKTAKKTIFVAILVLLMGAIASTSFLYVGITNEKEGKADIFEKRSMDLAKGIQGAMNDYELAASWIHESCRYWREDGFTYHNFRELYDYISGSGLEFFAMEWCPNVTRAERPGVEALAAEQYAVLPEGMTHNYSGIRGLNPEDPASMEMVNREEKPFYFPIHFFEPVSTVKGLYHYDVYSAPWEQPSVNLALQTWKPVATPGFKIVASGEQESFTTVLYHPGVPLPGKQPRDLSNILIQIKALLERSVRFQTESLGVYLFDKSEDMMFLGGMHIEFEGSEKNLEYFPDRIDLEDILKADRIYEEDIAFAARVWKVYVVPIDDSYKADFISICISGCLIFVAALLLTFWMINNMRRSIQLHRVMTKAAAEASIVSNLFPANVRDRMIQDAARKKEHGINHKKQEIFLNDGKEQNLLCKDRLTSLLTSEGLFGSKPIADLHPYTTIMFGDLVGFTAWSSVREPSQVFTLLEIVYHSFDNIARRRRVFKVETVGDCYVAVAGIPDQRKDHAVVMARFANDCLNRLNQLTKALETTLGPDTGDLAMRVGLHSGQVTAGVLRGDKGRFQLFGDTMNTASRMESTGVRNRIQCSAATAEHLTNAGFQKWVTPRSETVTVRGKGVLQTYFVKVFSGSRTSTQSGTTSSSAPKGLASTKEQKMERLVAWNVEVLSGLLKKIVARREATGKKASAENARARRNISTNGGMVLDEVKEIIALPAFDGDAIRKQVDPASVQLDKRVMDELNSLVSKVASMYRGNPFHSFEHASHVTMSVLKMMGRIENPKELIAKKDDDFDQAKLEARLHDHTFGVTSDPLSLFSCAFSALIHDLDHQGVPNSTLVNEGSPLAAKYNGQSVAEQNSVDLAWDLLMSPQFTNLRSCIYCDNEEFKRFRQLVVNSVMSTDIMDKQLGAARKARWNRAFSDESEDGNGDRESTEQDVNRKATIVIEHLIQASDVSHTMQHWGIYIKWNERLFHEMYKAYKQGRLPNDPSVGWHKGEMGFFDFYIIPLAKKLFTCGVFGVSSDEFLNYANINRKEWELKGEEMVQQYLKNFKVLYEGADESEYGDITDRADELEPMSVIFEV